MRRGVSKATESGPEKKGKAADRKREHRFELSHDGLPGSATETTSATAAERSIGALRRTTSISEPLISRKISNHKSS